MKEKDFIIAIEFLRNQIIEYLNEVTKGKTIEINRGTDTYMYIRSIKDGKVYYNSLDANEIISTEIYEDDIDLCSMDELYVILGTSHINEFKKGIKK